MAIALPMLPNDVVDPFLGDDLFVSELLAAILPASLLLQVSSTVTYLLHGRFTLEKLLKLRFAVFVTFFDASLTHCSAEYLQCVIV
jgi:hypothetical protein